MYICLFNIREGINKFKLSSDTFDEFPITEFENEHEGMIDISNNTTEHLQDKKRPHVTTAYRKLKTEKRRTDGYYMLLFVYARSPFGDIEIYLGIVVGLDGDDIRLI